MVIPSQDVIRVSVMQDQKATQTKSSTPHLVIKLPPQAEENKKKMVASSSPKEHENSSEEEEDEDWDAFQSFPASANEVDPSTKEKETNKIPIPDVSTEDTEFQVEGEILSAVEGTDQRKDVSFDFEEEGTNKVSMEEGTSRVSMEEGTSKIPISDISTEDIESQVDGEILSAGEGADQMKDLSFDFEEEGTNKVNMEENEVEGKDITD